MNRITHFEFHSADPERDMKFFSDVFNWRFDKFENDDGPEYWLATTGPDCTPGINGGMMRSLDGQARTVNTISVSDVDASATKVVANGGKICKEKMTIPGVGYLIFCTDPGGLLFGIFQQDGSAE
jgi:hypothetical protein